MPWTVMHTSECPASKPWGCINKNTGALMGCHETKQGALAQLAALNANVTEGDEAMEQRAYRPTEVRVSDDNPHVFEADVVTYGVVDTYDTIFDRGVFDESLANGLPKITWGHDWTDPIGRWVDWKNTDIRSEDDHGSLRLIGELDDFAAVPRAHQASAQLKSGTISQFSVGFHRHADGTYKDDDGIEHFRIADLDEVALVLKGAVPGTKLIGVRSARGGLRQVPEELVVDLAKQVAAGTLTKDAALIAVDLAAGTLGPTSEAIPPAADDEDPGVVVPAPGPSVEELDADDLLEHLGF